MIVDTGEEAPARDIAPAKLNLALHVRSKRADGRHEIETLFAFCTDGDRLAARQADDLSLDIVGPFAPGLEVDGNLVLKAAEALRQASGHTGGAAITLDKRLPVAAGIGGGSADAGAALRLLTGLWRIDPSHALSVAPSLGSDVPACLLSLPALGRGAGDTLSPVDLGLSGTPVLLVNPRVPLPTAVVFAAWDGADYGALSDWREGRNDLEAAAIALVPQIAEVLDWLSGREGVTWFRMSGSGATCFALFETSAQRDAAKAAIPQQWWKLASALR